MEFRGSFPSNDYSQPKWPLLDAVSRRVPLGVRGACVCQRLSPKPPCEDPSRDAPITSQSVTFDGLLEFLVSVKGRRRISLVDFDLNIIVLWRFFHSYVLHRIWLVKSLFTLL